MRRSSSCRRGSARRDGRCTSPRSRRTAGSRRSAGTRPAPPQGLEVIEMLRSTLVTIATSSAASGTCHRLVRLDHHPVAGTEARIRAIGIDDAAIHHGGSRPPASSSVATIVVVVVLPWVPAMATQLSAASARPASPRGAPRDAAFARRHQLRIVALDRGGDDDDRSAVGILGF